MREVGFQVRDANRSVDQRLSAPQRRTIECAIHIGATRERPARAVDHHECRKQ